LNNLEKISSKKYLAKNLQKLIYKKLGIIYKLILFITNSLSRFFQAYNLSRHKSFHLNPSLEKLGKIFKLSFKKAQAKNQSLASS